MLNKDKFIKHTMIEIRNYIDNAKRMGLTNQTVLTNIHEWAIASWLFADITAIIKDDYLILDFALFDKPEDYIVFEFALGDNDPITAYDRAMKGIR